MQVFADADYASVAADRKSVSGGLVMCGGACVSLFSRTKKCVTPSTTEAEYVTLVDVVKEVLLFRKVWRFMLHAVGMPCIPVFDNHELQLYAHRRTAPLPQGTNMQERYIDYACTLPLSAC